MPFSKEERKIGNAKTTGGPGSRIYEGVVDTPLDIRGEETDPVATATVGADFAYSISYLSAGDYTATFTCQAEQDNAGEVNDLEFSVVNTEVTIVDGEITIVDFSAPAP